MPRVQEEEEDDHGGAREERRGESPGKGYEIVIKKSFLEKL
jgi:hypothetical protein